MIIIREECNQWDVHSCIALTGINQISINREAGNVLSVLANEMQGFVQLPVRNKIRIKRPEWIG